jgi:hypothetical protein
MRASIARMILLASLAVFVLTSCDSGFAQQWGGWEDLGGVITAPPACVSWSANRIDCFARGTDNAMYHRWWDGTQWGGWEDLGGIITTPPACTSWGPNRIDCFAAGTDNAMYHRWWDGSQWGGWEDLGGIITTPPACTSWGPNRIDCFARGTDNAMYHRWWDGSQWGGWESLGGIITTRPSCVSWGPNRIDCFARGTDSAMYHRWWDGSQWGGWESLGGVITTPPACVSWSANRIDCFAAGEDFAMYHRWWDGHQWGGWESLGGVITSPPVCTSWSANRIDCFARGTDDAMYHRWWDGSQWGGWEDLGGIITTPPACTSWGSNRIDCFAAGTDNAMYHRWWPVFVRQGIAALTPSQIASLRKGVQVMMARAITDPTSYRFQANIHGTYDPATTPLESQAWNQCEHGSFYFFSWHRMYLYFFERILRASSGDPGLALPYWNWTDSAQRALPLPFRQPSDPSTNSLFIPVPGRQQAVDDGTAQLPAGVVSFSNAFTFTNFASPAGSGFSFGGQTTAPSQFNFPHGELESQPHDVVHGTLGGLMGDPDTAAGDPIFWLHHANIDRLWKRWLDQGGGRQDPLGDANWMNTVFTFYDENGHAVHMSGRQVINTVMQLDYRYDDDQNISTAFVLHAPPVTAQAVEAKRARQALTGSPVAAAAAGRSQLTEAPLTVTLPLAREVSTQLKAFLAPSAGRRFVLEVDDIQYDKSPGVYYEVYLNLPAGDKPDFHNPSFVGNLSFFALKPHQMAKTGAPAPPQRGGTRDFDVTKVVSGLMARNSWNDSQVSVTFVARGLVDRNGEQLAINPGAKASFGKVTIVVE